MPIVVKKKENERVMKSTSLEIDSVCFKTSLKCRENWRLKEILRLSWIKPEIFYTEHSRLRSDYLSSDPWKNYPSVCQPLMSRAPTYQNNVDRDGGNFCQICISSKLETRASYQNNVDIDRSYLFQIKPWGLPKQIVNNGGYLSKQCGDTLAK